MSVVVCRTSHYVNMTAQGAISTAVNMTIFSLYISYSYIFLTFAQNIDYGYRLEILIEAVLRVPKKRRKCIPYINAPKFYI